MKKLIVTMALSVIALPAWAGMTYEFRSSTEGQGASQLVGKAAIEGGKMRMEIQDGDGVLFNDGSVVISSDGGATLLILDPEEKTYTELRTDELFSTLGALMKSAGPMFRMTIENPSVNVREAGDGGTVEGYPTRKYVIDSSYEMSMRVMGMSRKTTITSETEAWVTDSIDTGYATFIQQRGLKTGMEDFDRLIDQQANAMKGFPLKQIVRTTTTAGNRTDTSTTTLTVTNIREETVPASRFEVPAGYEKVEAPALPGFGG